MLMFSRFFLFHRFVSIFLKCLRFSSLAHISGVDKNFGGSKNEIQATIFVFTTFSDFSSTSSRMNFSTECSKLGDVNASRANPSMKEHSRASFSTFSSRISFSALLSSKSIRTFVRKQMDFLFNPPFADSNLIWDVSKSASSAIFRKYLSISSA